MKFTTLLLMFTLQQREKKNKIDPFDGFKKKRRKKTITTRAL